MPYAKTYQDISELKVIPLPEHNRFNNLTGQVFGRITIISLNSKYRGQLVWNCKCSCGNYCAINGLGLRNGTTSSCGCLSREITIKRHTKHGLHKTREYKIWTGMKARCLNKKSISYKNYGGRQITVCTEWLNSFDNFYKDMGSAPTNKHTLERIDNNNGYCKENCRWATYREQSRNKRNNNLVTYNNKTQCAADWDKEMGFTIGVVSHRINSGWSVEKAMTTPKRHRKSKQVI